MKLIKPACTNKILYVGNLCYLDVILTLAVFSRQLTVRVYACVFTGNLCYLDVILTLAVFSRQLTVRVYACVFTGNLCYLDVILTLAVFSRQLTVRVCAFVLKIVDTLGILYPLPVFYVLLCCIYLYLR